MINLELDDLHFYNEIKQILASARAKAYSAVNFAMVDAYWNIGKSIVQKQGGDERVEYGASLFKGFNNLLLILVKALL